jgi:5-methylcytosine-specific restriction protein A
MNLRDEKSFALLASIKDIGGSGTKKQVLDNIELQGYIVLTPADLRLKSNRNELHWRNDLAFVRKNLADRKLVDDSIRDTWAITDEGTAYLHELADEVLAASNANTLRKLTDNAVARIQESDNDEVDRLRSKTVRNPSWVQDEVILALDLYFRHNPSRINKHHQVVKELSDLLRQLPIHDSRTTGPDFRNPNGVYMKMGNFLSLDPSYSGKGLASVSKLDREVWDEFVHDRERLEATANAIKDNYRLVDIPISQDDEAEEEFAEGRLLTRLHILRERNQSLVKKKKEHVLKETSKLLCEVCNFDFATTYGDLGVGFAECHHTKPLSTFQPNDKTKLSDLAIVCANCHRMLHQGKELTSIEELRGLVSNQRAQIVMP